MLKGQEHCYVSGALRVCKQTSLADKQLLGALDHVTSPKRLSGRKCLANDGMSRRAFPGAKKKRIKKKEKYKRHSTAKFHAHVCVVWSETRCGTQVGVNSVEVHHGEIVMDSWCQSYLVLQMGAASLTEEHYCYSPKHSDRIVSEKDPTFPYEMQTIAQWP